MTGSGTLLDPYVIWDVNDLQNMALDLTAYYELGQDIDASATSGWNWDGAQFLGFEPIGDIGNAFTGNLNGAGHVIDSLYCNYDRLYLGLFGYATGATISNAILERPVVIGGHYVAAFVARAGNCTIQNCHVRHLNMEAARSSGGFASLLELNSQVSRCSVQGTIQVSGIQRYIGGFVDEADNVTISGCSADVVIHSTTGDFLGGFVSFSWGATIQECFSTGSIEGWEDIGGFAYRISSTSIVNNCYSLADVTCTLPRWHSAGFVAEMAGGVVTNSYSVGRVTHDSALSGGFCGARTGGTITACLWDTQTSGKATSDGGTGKTTAEMKSWATFLDAGWDIRTHKVHDPTGGYPWLSWQVPGASPIWYIYYVAPGPGPPPIPVVATLPATGVR